MGERVQTGVYQGAGGKSVSRSLAEVSIMLLTVEKIDDPLATVDELIARQIRIAQAQNRNSITVLDLGSGEGNMLRDIIEFPELMPHTVVALREIRIPDFTINLIGLTDTERLFNPPSIAGTEYTSTASTIVPSGTNYPTKFVNYAYAITHGQSFEDFLRIHKDTIGTLDLVLSTETMMYLAPEIFKSTLSQIANALAPGGRCVIEGYKHIGSKWLSISDLRRPRITPDSLEDLRNRGIDMVIRGEDDTNEGMAFSSTLRELWVRMAREALDTYMQLTEQQRLISDRALTSHKLLSAQLSRYENGIEPTLQELSSVNIVELESLLYEIDCVYVREAKERIVDEFERDHPHMRVTKGTYLLSINYVR